jgi:hypothetical protein
MSTDPGAPGPRETSPEQQEEHEQARAPEHARPDEVRERVGLDEDRTPDPDGAPPPRERSE